MPYQRPLRKWNGGLGQWPSQLGGFRDFETNIESNNYGYSAFVRHLSNGLSFWKYAAIRIMKLPAQTDHPDLLLFGGQNAALDLQMLSL